MTALRVSYARVRRVANELLGSQRQPPVDLEKVASAKGAQIRYSDLAGDISGILFREGDRRVIIVNEHHPVARQRFTIAHEIGHLALHRGVDVHVDEGFRYNFRNPRSATAEDIEEIEANAFAANLLMPADWLRNDIRAHTLDLNDDSEIAELADKYQVSPQAILIRLSTLFK